MSEDNSELPRGWRLAPLGEVLEVWDTLREPINAKERATRVGNIPYYGANGQAGTIDDFRFDGDYVLLAEDGGNFDEPAKGVAYRVTGRFWVNNHAHVLKPICGMDTRYVVNALNAMNWMPFVSGTTRLKLNQSKMKSAPMLVPPLPEQRRIVAKIEALQERSRAARAALAEVGPLLEQFRQSLLAAAFRGDLTADWRAQNPNTEPATELLNRIRKKRRQRWEKDQLAKYEAKGKKPPKGWKEKYTEDEQIDDSDLPDLPDGWCWTSFATIATIDSRLVSPLDFPNHPHVAPDNIQKETGRLLGYRSVSEDGVKSNKNHFFPGQIVYSKIRPYLSKVIVAGFEGLCSADMYPITAAIHTSYLCRYMLSSSFLTDVQNRAGNRVVLPKVNQKQLNDVRIPVPPLNEQIVISQKLEDAVEQYEAVAIFISESKADLNQLDQSILAKAFRGELVPQDPSDEPAAVLLDRIRQQREAAAANGKPAKRGRKKK